MSVVTLPPAVEPNPIRTLIAGLADLIQRVGPDSVYAHILANTQRELASLNRAAVPPRLTVAA
jgi:hypothetical protein